MSNPHSNENEISCAMGCLAAAIGAVLGALALFWVYDALVTQLAPDMKRGGQYGMVGLYLFPVGALVGGVLGFCLPYWVKGVKGGRKSDP
jgi:MFS family permease